MECQIELWVTGIDYNGDNIGRNFEFKLKSGNVNSKFSKAVKCGSWVTCNELIYKKRLLQETSVDFEILVTEKDKHPDQGRAIFTLSLNSGSNNLIRSLPIEVMEVGSNNAGEKAIITLTIVEKRYVLGEKTLIMTADDGWIEGLRKNGKSIPLPYGLKVDFLKVEDSREFFKILEGHEKRKEASIKFENGTTKTRFTEIKLYKPPCYITYNKTKDTVKIKGIAREFLVTMMHSAVLPDGIYKLEMPDFPHGTNPDYFKYSVYAQTWFRIVYPGGYYFHFGSISEGCITVLTQGNPNDSWTKIYKHIVLCRDPQEAGIIGRLEVVS